MNGHNAPDWGRRQTYRNDRARDRPGCLQWPPSGLILATSPAGSVKLTFGRRSGIVYI